FPIAAKGLLVYRTYTDVRAVYLREESEREDDGKIVKRKPGEIKWKTTSFDGALATLLGPGGKNLGTGGFSNLLYENTTLGTLATDHRYVYIIDDLAVPPAGSLVQQNPFQPAMSSLSEGLRP